MPAVLNVYRPSTTTPDLAGTSSLVGTPQTPPQPQSLVGSILSTSSTTNPNAGTVLTAPGTVNNNAGTVLSTTSTTNPNAGTVLSTTNTVNATPETTVLTTTSTQNAAAGTILTVPGTQYGGSPASTSNAPQSTANFANTFNATFSENPLNAYYQPTYHFRLFVASDIDLLQQSNGSISGIADVPQITIAETGVTGYNIKDVEFSTVADSTAEYNFQNATFFQMTVVDPIGVSFLDALYAAAAQIGMTDYTKANYYLALSFKGYDSNGIAVNSIPVLKQSLWVWSLILTTIDTKINEGGGVFVLHLVNVEAQPVLADNRYVPDILTTPNQSITVKGSTVQEALASLQQGLNDAWKADFKNTNNGNATSTGMVQLNPILVEPIQIGPNQNKDPNTFQLKAKQPDLSSILTWSMQDGKMTCLLPPNTALGVIIIAIIASTEDGQKLVIDTNDPSTPDMSPTQVNERNVRECTTFSIEKVIKNIAREELHGNYVKAITLRVIGHYTQRPILTPTQRDTSQTPAAQQNALGSLINYGLLNKQYQYIFTGMNTEVLDCDISWNMTYVSMAPKIAGARTTSNNIAPTAKLNANTKATNNVGPQAAQQLKVDVGALASSPTSLAAGSLAPSNPTAPATPKPLAPTWTPTSQLASLVTPTLTGPSASTATTPTSTTMTTTPVETTQAKGNTYIENTINGINRRMAVPVSFYHADTSIDAGIVNTGQYHPGLSLVGSVFHQLNSGSATTAFQKINLGIHGDPFWLGQTNIQRQIVTEKLQPSHVNKGALPDYASGEQTIYLRFLYPLRDGDNFQPVLKTSEVFAGIYAVQKITHTFGDGQFKQTLEATRMPLLNVDMALSASSATSGSGGSNSGLPQAGSGSSPNGTGTAPSTGGSALTPTKLASTTATPTAIQSGDSSTIGNLTSGQLAAYKAAIGTSESGNNPLQGNNGLGYVGQYQMGMASLEQTGYVSGGTTNDPSTWTWTGQNNVNSLGDFLNNAQVQNSAMDTYTTDNYNALVGSGTINSSSSPEQVAGYLGAAHIAGAGGAANFANGYGNPSDAFGTSAGNYYSLGYNAARLTSS